MHHLHIDEDVVWRLHELIGAVVERAHHARARGITETKQAAFCQRQSLRALIATLACQIASAIATILKHYLRRF